MLDFSKIKNGVNLYFIRHGESNANMNGTIGGGIDHNPMLTSLGKEQAKTAGVFLREVENLKPDLIITSILSRAIDTSKIIGKELSYNKEIIELKDLVEIETGIFTDHTYDEVKDKFPNEWSLFKEKVWDGVPGADSSISIKERLGRYFDLLFESTKENANIITVCHWGILQWIVNMLNASDTWKPLIQFRNCSISKLIVKSYDDGIMRSRDGKEDIKSFSRNHEKHSYIEWDYIGLEPNRYKF